MQAGPANQSGDIMNFNGKVQVLKFKILNKL